MDKYTSIILRRARGHTLIELMVAIAIGVLLVLGAFTVLAAFEGRKRTTTAMNDALQSGGYGLYQVDKLIRSAGTGLGKYATMSGYGCALNYTPTGGSLVTSGVTGSLPAPFTGIVGTAAKPLRLVPAVILSNASTVTGSTASAGGAAAQSDALLLMLGGNGYSEVPIKVESISGSGPSLSATVGLSVGEWVLGGGTTISDCLVTTVAATFAGYGGGNVVAPLSATTVGSKTLATNDYVLGLGTGAAANFSLIGVNGTTDTMQMLDLLNSDLSAGAVQSLSDDVVILRAVYYVQVTSADTLTWTNPVSGVALTSGTYDYTPAGLLAGTTAANLALQGIKAIRIAMVVRAPLDEKTAANEATSFDMFSSLPSAQHVTWYAPASQNYRYREIETTIPVRNNMRNASSTSLNL